MPSATRRSPLQERSRLTVDALVEAAAQVFERHGYAAGTTNRVAERAGVSIGTLYQYFSGKDALLHAVCERHLADGTAVLGPCLAALSDDPAPADALRPTIAAMVALHADRPRLHRMLFEESPLTPELRARVAELEEAAVGVVAAYLSRRPSPPRDPALTARILVDAIGASTHRFALDALPAGADQGAFVAEATRVLAAGI